ncbi:MAG: hypothetical protein WAK85_05280, partial [Xanthobacteraceae bacterium]
EYDWTQSCARIEKRLNRDASADSGIEAVTIVRTRSQSNEPVSSDAYFEQQGIKKYDCNTVRPNSDGFVSYPSSPKEKTYTVHTNKLMPDESGVLMGIQILVIKGCIGYETFQSVRYSWFRYFFPTTIGPMPVQKPDNSPVCPRGTNGAI